MDEDPNLIVRVPHGNMCEQSDWEIHRDVVCSVSPCRHCYRETSVREALICPRVVLTYNEGGYSATIVCLDCILEAAVQLQPGVAYMPVPRCDMCKWWTEMMPPNGQGECTLFSDSAKRGSVDRLAIAWAIDEPAALITRSNFGCVQWQAKP